MSNRTSGNTQQSCQTAEPPPLLPRTPTSALLALTRQGSLAWISPEAAALLHLTAPPSEPLPLALLPLALQTIAKHFLQPRPPRPSPLDVPELGVRACAFELPLSLAPAGLCLLTLTPSPSATASAQALSQLDRLASLGTMAASMAHEIRNALVSSKTFVELLLEKNQDAELAGLAHRELARIDTLANTVLRYSRAVPSETTPLHLHPLLDYVLGLLESQASSRSIQLDRQWQASCDLIQGNEQALQQALLNLLLNAVEAIGSEGTIRIQTATFNAPAPQLRVCIQDTGPGIAREDQARIFELFFTRKPHGTGLGLAITRRIVAEHKGHISVSSPPGQGALFTLEFPLLTAPA